MPTLFFTGFPGFLGSELLPRVLNRYPQEVDATCLVQGKFLTMARQRAAELEKTHPELAGRLKLVEGDITVPGLGLTEGAAVQQETLEIFHLAAVYDLSVKRELAMKVNVDGTRHMLDFAAGCPGLKRFQYVSTCYVSGRYAGPFREEDLEKNQAFNNYYEETKHLAEIEVRRRRDAGMPVTVYRPAIVVGDSQTGVTQKYDGPYFILQWMLRQGKLAIVPMVGNPLATRVNLVPRDFVVDALAYLSGLEASLGKTYQLSDPAPLTVSELVELMGAVIQKRPIPVPLPLGLAKLAIDKVPGVYRLLRIPSDSVDYFVHPTHYTCDNTLADLKGSGIVCPPFASYLPNMVTFMKAHPEISSAAMV